MLQEYSRAVAHKISGGRLEDFSKNPERISWSRALLNSASKGRGLAFRSNALRIASYRPFFKQWVYFGRDLNEMVYQLDEVFPNKEIRNRVISIVGRGEGKPFECLMTDHLIEYKTFYNGQHFPQHLYNREEEETGSLFDGLSPGIQRRDAITDPGLKHFQDVYSGETITKDDLFYYIYGLLHSEDYRAQYANNLSKELPRIPRVKTAADFWAFSHAGRELGDLHVNYETVEPYPVTIKQGDLRLADIKNPEAFYRVTKWAFGKAGKEKDKTTVIYNANITMQDVPLEAYEYVVNGKPALEWVMERQVVKTDKASGIVNDANRYAIETMGNPAYPLELFQRVITVSLRTMEIVRGLPKLEVME